MTARHACINCSFFLFCNTILCFTLVFFIVWSIFLPQEPIFRITNASLTQFDFTNTNNTLHYNLELKITIKNQGQYRIQWHPSNCKLWKKEVFFADFEFYTLSPSSQEHNHFGSCGTSRATTIAQLQGHRVSQYMVETAAGSYSIDVQLPLQLKIGYDIFNTRYYQLSSNKIDCKLKVPLSTEEKYSLRFKSTKCGNVNIISDPVV